MIYCAIQEQIRLNSIQFDSVCTSVICKHHFISAYKAPTSF